MHRLHSMNCELNGPAAGNLQSAPHEGQVDTSECVALTKMRHPIIQSATICLASKSIWARHLVNPLAVTLFLLRNSNRSTGYRQEEYN